MYSESVISICMKAREAIIALEDKGVREDANEILR